MAFGLTAICIGIPAQAQTEEGTVKVVDTAAVLARLNAKGAPGLAPTRRGFNYSLPLDVRVQR